MSNHYHLAIKVCPEQLENLSEDDIMDRWYALFKGQLLIQYYRSGADAKPFERAGVSDIRERLQPEFDAQQGVDDQTGCGDLLDFKTPLKPLLPFENRLLNEPQSGILFNFEQYLALVD